MKQACENREAARAALSNRWATASIYCFLFGVIIFFLILFSLCLPLAGLVLVLPVHMAFEISFLKCLRKDERAFEFGDLFNYYGKYFGAAALKFVYLLLWSLLFVVPAIVKSYSYSMTSYIVHDNPGIGADAAIEASKKMMSGHKLELFWLYLTFIGWWFLAWFTCGIGFYVLTSYIETAKADFYQSLLNEGNITSEIEQKQI
ncbi:MAG: DUF975 family protein [Bacteroidaceae bacterium]|uniref:DUF975 family protein n=1 Tax=unclassified Bacteroides TaxID=2646097 RepID=UPI0004E0C89B|nr:MULTISPECIES: DUF975 family protein [unclassified Bacteroides]MBQ7484018.1 DUF975 family protein [Bacteroidaceae bacterium]